ncbi:hypothetical protein [Microbulbifer epialgicus]|uniref:CVNH domain-containing protein n=1 Tax=Microbulbifer epialgicus TaxID=393907 RepID=A0ABV4P8F7_9GAMM
MLKIGLMTALILSSTTSLANSTTCPSQQLSHNFVSQGELYQCIGVVKETPTGFRASSWNLESDTTNRTGEDCWLGDFEATHAEGILTNITRGSICKNYCDVQAYCNDNGEWVDFKYTW